MGLDDSNFFTFPFFQTKKCIKLLQVKLTFIQVYLKGTMKRLVKLESLRMPFENQILTPWDMYEWADENIENKIILLFNGGHCFTYLSQSKQADYCRNNWWHKKLSLFLTKWSNKAWAIYPVSWWDMCC